MMFPLFFTLWLNLHSEPCDRVTANPWRITMTTEREGMSVVYDGTLEAFYSNRLEEWRFYRTDSPYTDADSGTLATIFEKVMTGDTSLFAIDRPAWCSLPISSRQRA